MASSVIIGSQNNISINQEVLLRPYLNLSLLAGYSNLGLGYATAQYRKLSNGIVDIKGVIKKSSVANNAETIANNLPISCRPTENRVKDGWFNGSTGNKGSGVFVNSDGTIQYAGGDNNVTINYLSIEQTFITDRQTAIFFGDSITFGLGASTTANRWSSLTAGNQNLNEDNQGISGTVLQNSAPILNNNGFDRHVTAILNNFPDRVYILYGLNDLRYNGASFSVINFQNQLETIIQNLINFDVNRNNIIIGSPPYMVTAGYTRSDYAPFNAGSVTKHRQYEQATKEVASKLRVRWANVYQKMIDNGGDSLIDPDQVHPNNTGHGIIRDAMVEASFV